MKKTVYLRNVPTDNVWLYSPTYFKVVQTGKDESFRVEVTKTGIETAERYDFFDEVHFIKDKLCNTGCDEITRKEFDSFYIDTIRRINQFTSI